MNVLDDTRGPASLFTWESWVPDDDDDDLDDSLTVHERMQAYLAVITGFALCAFGMSAVVVVATFVASPSLARFITAFPWVAIYTIAGTAAVLSLLPLVGEFIFAAVRLAVVLRSTPASIGRAFPAGDCELWQAQWQCAGEWPGRGRRIADRTHLLVAWPWLVLWSWSRVLWRKIQWESG